MTLTQTNHKLSVSEDTRISPANIKALQNRILTLEESENYLRGVVDSFQQLVESIQDGVTFIENGRIAYNNPRSQAIFGPPGTETSELLGLHLALPHEADRLQQVVNQIWQTGQPPTEIQFWIARPDGVRCCIHNKIAPMISEGKLMGWYVITSDVTERAQREREFQAINSLSSALRKANSMKEMLPVILQQAQDLLMAEHAALMLIEPHSGDLLVAAGAGEWHASQGARIPAGEGLTHQVLKSGKPFFSDTPGLEFQLAGPETVSGLHSQVCFPFNVQSRSLGALWLGSQGSINAADRGMLSAIANIAANALDRASAHEETLASVQRMQTLHTIDMAITSSLDLQVTLGILVEQVIASLQVDAADILVFHPQTSTLELVTQRGFQTPVQPFEIPISGSQAGNIAYERKRCHISDLQTDPRAVLRIPALEQESFSAYIGIPLIAKGAVKGVLEVFHRGQANPDLAWMDFLETLGTQAAIALDSSHLFYDLQRSNMELMLAYDATLEGWSHALDLRDKETEGHTQRVTSLSIELARSLGLRNEALVHMRRGALLHDIGKMGIPDNILRKPGELTGEERELMHQHPVFAYDLLAPITYLAPSLHIPYCHHEHWDGAGYPRGLRGEEIPLPARIFAVIDVWDALRSDRPYRPAWSEEKALVYIMERSGKQFDPVVVDHFLRLYERGRLTPVA